MAEKIRTSEEASEVEKTKENQEALETQINASGETRIDKKPKVDEFLLSPMRDDEKFPLSPVGKNPESLDVSQNEEFKISKPEKKEVKKEISVPKSKNLKEALSNLESDEARERFLKKFKGRETHVFLKDEKGVKKLHYLRLKDGEEKKFNEDGKLVFEVFDEYGDRPLDKDGKEMELVKDLKSIKFNNWKKGEPSDEDGYKNVLFRNEQGKIDKNFLLINNEQNGTKKYSFRDVDLLPGEIVKYEDGQGKVAYSMQVEPRPETEEEILERQKLTQEHADLLENAGELCYDNAERFGRENNQELYDFYLKRLDEVKKYDQSKIVNKIRSGEMELWRLQEEVESLRKKWEQYQQVAKNLEVRLAKKPKGKKEEGEALKNPAEMPKNNVAEIPENDEAGAVMAEIKIEKYQQAKEVYLKETSKEERSNEADADKFEAFLQGLKKKFGINKFSACEALSSGTRLDKLQEDSITERAWKGVKSGGVFALAGGVGGGLAGAFLGPVGAIIGAPVGAFYGIKKGVDAFAKEKITIPLDNKETMVFESSEEFETWISEREQKLDPALKDYAKRRVALRTREKELEMESKAEDVKSKAEDVKISELKEKCFNLIKNGKNLCGNAIKEFKDDADKKAVDYFTGALSKFEAYDNKATGLAQLNTEAMERAVTTISNKINECEVKLEEFRQEAIKSSKQKIREEIEGYLSGDEKEETLKALEEETDLGVLRQNLDSLKEEKDPNYKPKAIVDEIADIIKEKTNGKVEATSSKSEKKESEFNTELVKEVEHFMEFNKDVEDLDNRVRDQVEYLTDKYSEKNKTKLSKKDLGNFDKVDGFLEKMQNIRDNNGAKSTADVILDILSVKLVVESGMLDKPVKKGRKLSDSEKEKGEEVKNDEVKDLREEIINLMLIKLNKNIEKLAKDKNVKGLKVERERYQSLLKDLEQENDINVLRDALDLLKKEKK